LIGRGEASGADKTVGSETGRSMRDEASYLCDGCGEEIVIPLDLSQGDSQEYVEDCPVCCQPNIVHVEIDPDGEAQVWSEPEEQ
jgi:hypothetical protein